MLRHDIKFYRLLLCEMSLGDLVSLYERTAPEYAALAKVIAEELTQRMEQGIMAAA